MGQRADHVELGILHSFVSGDATMDDETREHIELCELCRSDISFLEWLADFGVRERTYDPPSWALTNAENVFGVQKPGIVTRKVIASLIYDSFTKPLPVGVRHRDLPARQALYQAGDLMVDLKIELGDEKSLVIGQIVSGKGDTDLNHLQVEISHETQVIGKSRTNALGEFIFRNLPKGNYELQVLLSDTMLKLPALRMND